MRFVILCVGVFLALGSSWIDPAQSQTIKPLDVESDPNGVDLLSGKVETRMPELSVPGSSHLRMKWIDDLLPYLTGRLIANSSTSSYDVNGGGSTSDHFDCEGECDSKKKNGSSLTADPSNGTFTYREGGSGKEIYFNLRDGPQDTITSQTQGFGFHASYIKYENGETLTLGYKTVTTSDGHVHRRPISVTSNLGYTLKLVYVSDTYGQSGYSTISEAAIYKSGLLEPVASLTYSGTSITDLGGREWICTGCPTDYYHTSRSRVTSLRLPGQTVNAFETEAQSRTYYNTEFYGTVTHSNWVTKVITDGVAWNYSYIPGGQPQTEISKVTITGPLDFSRTVEIDSDQARPEITSIVDSLNRTTRYEYNNDGLVTRITYPELNAATVVYDGCGNIVESSLIAKPGSGEANIVQTASFPTAQHCDISNIFKPIWTRDAKNQQTDYTWSGTHGGLLTKLEPADANGQRRKTINVYVANNGVYRLTRQRVCLVTAAGANLTCGTADEQVKEIAYWGSTLLPLTETVTDGAGTQALTTTYAYDPAGRATSVDGPLPGTDDATYYRYDPSGRRTWEIGPKGSDGYRAATFTTWREADDKPLKVEKGVVTDPVNPVLVELGEERYKYNARRNLIRTIAAIGATNHAITQMGYDGRNRLLCTAVRMNRAAWSSLPSSACDLGTPSSGDDGPDRITRNTYDAESRLLKVRKAYGVTTANGFPATLQQDEATYTYSPNGQRLTVEDANGNLASLTYDGHDRQVRWTFPSRTTPGQVNTADYEEYDYDLNGNRISLRKRDGSTLTYEYDALDRMIRKTVPSRAGLAATHTRDVFYGYDVGDRQLYARFDSATGEGVTNGYDSLGRLVSTSLDMEGPARTLAYTLDAGGRRTQLEWPDGRKTSYAYDPAGRMTAIHQGALGSTNALWTYDYSDYGRDVLRTALNGQSAKAESDGLGRLTALTIDLSGTASDNETTFAYNPASQVASRTMSNDAYAWNGHVNVTRAYAVNGLNQYTSAGSATFSYDANGNLTSDGSTTYLYDVENRLVSASGANNAELRYDPLGRLYEVVAGGVTTWFVHDGDELVAEYLSGSGLDRRYVHGASIDDPVVWYEGAYFNNPRWLVADHQGSIVAITDASATLTRNSYDEYGIPGTGNEGRFQYTGQVWLPELGLYYYKARIYSPTLGRFLQTDPIGYEDQINLYAYVGNDPLNGRDPSGMRNCDIGDPNCIETPESEENPDQPEENPPETDKKDEIVVTAQRERRNTSGWMEKFFVVTVDTFERRDLRQREIRCRGGGSVTVGVADPIPSGASAAHSHPSNHSGVPGPGDNNFGNTSNTGYVITPSRAYAIDRSSNGTYRTRIMSGEPLSASERGELVGNMQNWESGNSSDNSKTPQQRFCS